jgi:hypothetical protein
MVTFGVIGERGYLGSVVKRRWLELGATWDPIDPDHIIYAIRPDDLALAFRLAETGPTILPSTDAIHENTDYASGKRALERVPGAVVIRAGIVDTRHAYGVAYRNWWCSPLTPLEWADLAWDRKDEPGLHLAGRETLTRYEVERLVAEVWDRPAPVAAFADDRNDRAINCGDYPPLRDALVEYREWLQS